MITLSSEVLRCLLRAAKQGSVLEFLDFYRPAAATDPEIGTALLWEALLNRDDAARTAIVTRLLDDGADPSIARRGTTALHVLLDGNQHTPEAEAPLLAMMLERGASVNAVDPTVGTPLETIAARFKFTDDDLKPFYDVLFDRKDLALLQTSIYGDTVLTNLRKWSAQRAGLVARAEAYLTDRGIPVPSA